MSNIYEALEQIRRKNAGSGVTPELALQTEVLSGITLRSEMNWLHQQVESLLAKAPSRILQFVGSRRGEGVSTIVREFAKIAVERHGKAVLVLDAAYQDTSPRISINGPCDYGWLDLLDEGELIDKAFFRVGDSNMYFAPISVQASLLPSIKDASMSINLWEKLKERFDLILIDSSSHKNSAESVAMSANVDGVIIVIEAEKSKKSIIAKLKKRIETNGGSVIGVILNKRKYHIPKFIYNKMFE